MFNNVLFEIKEKVVQEIESVTGVKTDYKKPRLLSGGDSKEITHVLNKEPLNTANKRQNQVSDHVMNLISHISTHGLAHSHILSVDMFSKEQLNEIFNLAQTLRVYVIKGRPLDNILKVKLFVRNPFFIELNEYMYLAGHGHGFDILRSQHQD